MGDHHCLCELVEPISQVSLLMSDSMDYCLILQYYLFHYCWSYQHQPVRCCSYTPTAVAVYFHFETNKILEVVDWDHSGKLVEQDSEDRFVGQVQLGQIHCCTIRVH